jgi:small subunit ribosomal protein S9
MTTKNEQYFKAVGRRKSSIASVWLKNEKGQMTVNGKEVKEIEGIDILKLVGVNENIEISIKVSGGGKESQKGAIKLGVARALEVMNPEFRTTLKKEGLLSRDSREKERKKPGLTGARRAPQWAKR